jgi:hypothetical protein
MVAVALRRRRNSLPVNMPLDVRLNTSNLQLLTEVVTIGVGTVAATGKRLGL